MENMEQSHTEHMSVESPEQFIGMFGIREENIPLFHEELGVEIYAHGNEITLTGEEELATVTRTDAKTGETITCTVKTASVTVTGDVSPSAPVYAATYGANGQMTDVKILTEPGTASIGSGAMVKLMWVNSGTFTAKCAFVQVNLK